jgi:glyoxylate/hydroxypyruvate reductase A
VTQTARSVFLTTGDWDLESWRQAFSVALAQHPVVTQQDTFSPDSVRYAATWRHPSGSLKAYPNLAAIFSLGAGVDHVFADKDLPDVPIVRVVDPDLTGRMSEWVLLHVLMHHRQQRMYDWQQHEKIWDEDRRQPAAHEVTVGVMGLGEIGHDAARKLHHIGFSVRGWSRTAKTIEGIACYWGDKDLDTFLAGTEILVSLMPLTPQTRGILSRKLFERLSRNGHFGAPILLNAGRGGLQVERDIIECLEDGTLFAATLDVFETEPLPKRSPLWHHPRVTISPHNSGISAPSSITRYIAAQIDAHERGEPLQNIVDRKRQY